MQGRKREAEREGGRERGREGGREGWKGGKERCEDHSAPRQAWMSE